MKALRDLLGFGQYTVVRLMQDERIIRESEVSAIEGKIGYKHLWNTYASFYKPLIETSGHSETVKEIMRTLLKEWEEAS
jgi:hypothetical protein